MQFERKMNTVRNVHEKELSKVIGAIKINAFEYRYLVKTKPVFVEYVPPRVVNPSFRRESEVLRLKRGKLNLLGKRIGKRGGPSFVLASMPE
jgi:hypothetical protein